MQHVLARLVLIVAATIAQPAFAQNPPTPTAGSSASEREAEFQAAAATAWAVAKHGPATTPLGGEGTLQLPANYAFVPQPEAGRLMRAGGNNVGLDLVGVILPEGDENWTAVVRFIQAGYIKDGDAKNWNADELLTSLREGTAEGNADRVARGFPALEVKGWVEKPAYDAASHRLIWSALATEAGAPEGGESVNYNTYALGRNGYFSLNFITDVMSIEQQKPIARELLGAIRYDAGKAYADFDSATDRVAEYGLAALVGGVAAKKLGLLAVIVAFATKFAKIIALGALALAGVFAKFFKRQPKTNSSD